MFPLRSEPMPNRKWGQARDVDYSCWMFPLREPMPSEPSCTDGIDGEGSAAAGAAEGEQPVVVAGRPADEHVLEHLLDRAGRTAVADEIGAKFTVRGPAEGHVIAQDLDLFPVLDNRSECAMR